MNVNFFPWKAREICESFFNKNVYKRFLSIIENCQVLQFVPAHSSLNNQQFAVINSDCSILPNSSNWLMLAILFYRLYNVIGIHILFIYGFMY